MIYYVSESLNSKKNGGSSLSGLDFLQIMRTHYSEVSVVSYDGVNHQAGETFYGFELNDIHESTVLGRVYSPPNMTNLRKIKKFLIAVQNLFKRNYIDIAGQNINETDVVYVNSLSQIINSEQVKSFDKAKKVCVVRGYPESFVWQGASNDSEKNIQVAADYLNKFDALIFVSSIGMERWSKYLQPNVSKFYLPNSINEIEAKSVEAIPIEKIRNELGFELDVVNFVALGSVQIRKGQDFLLEVAKKMIDRGYLFKIHIIGVVSKAWGGKEIVEKIKSSDFSESFVFHGHKDNVFEYIKAADICLFPSRAEAFPRTIAEYMSLGKPIVSTNVSGVPEMIEHGLSGLLSDCDDVDSFVNNISELLDDSRKKVELGECAKKKYYDKFSKNSQVKAANQIFNAIDVLNDK